MKYQIIRILQKKIKQCHDLECELIYNQACSIMNQPLDENQYKAVLLFEQIIEYKDSAEKIEQYKRNLEDIYNKACSIYNLASSKNDFSEAEQLFRKIASYKDSQSYIDTLNNVEYNEDSTYQKICFIVISIMLFLIAVVIINNIF